MLERCQIRCWCDPQCVRSDQASVLAPQGQNGSPPDEAQPRENLPSLAELRRRTALLSAAIDAHLSNLEAR